MIVTRLMKPEDTDVVRSYLDSNRHASTYHTLGWRKVLEATYGYPSQNILCLKDNRIVGLLPLALVRNFKGQKKIVALPFSHFVEPLYDSSDVLDALIFFVEKTAIQKKAGYLEIKSHVGNYLNWQHSSAYMISELNLNRDISAILKRLKPSVRRNIKKAKASHIDIRVENSRIAIDSFYDLIVETRQRQGSLPYSRRFFHYLFQYLEPSQRKLFTAYSGSQAIAGLIMLYHGKRAIYAYGASKNDRKLLQMRPNELLFWKSIEEAHQKEFDIYDFGITPLNHSSLLRFKTQWGPENRKLYYSYYLCRSKAIPHIDRSGVMTTLASKVFSRLPKPVLKVVGPILLRYLG